MDATPRGVPTVTSPRDARASAVKWVVILGVADAVVWALVAAALRSRWYLVAALFAYPALSVLVVTFLYVRAIPGRNPGPYMKGVRAPWLQPILLPYRAVAYTLTLLARVVRLHAVSTVTPSLYLGARLLPSDAHRLDAVGVRFVLDLCAECPTNVRHAREPFARYELPVLDRCAPTLDELDAAVAWVVATIASGGRVYVHCAFGRGRSALAVAAALVGLGLAHDADDALAFLARARPTISLNAGQRAALEHWVARRASRPPP